MFFKEGQRLALSCISEAEAAMRVTPTGKNVTTTRVRCSGKWGVKYFELTAWEAAAKAMEGAIKQGGLRIVAFGIPTEGIWKDRVQSKLNVEELWVENLLEKRFDEVISRNGVPEAEERVYEPIVLPDSLAIGNVEAVDASKGRAKEKPVS